MKCPESMACKSPPCELREIGRTELHQCARPFVAALRYQAPETCPRCVCCTFRAEEKSLEPRQ